MSRRLLRERSTWLAAALLALVVVCALLAQRFLSFEIRDGRLFGALVDVLRRSAPVALVALGMTLVIGVGGIDLSVGAVMAIAGVLAGRLLESGLGDALALVLGLGAGAGLGLANGGLVRGLALQPLVATLVLLVGGRGLAQVLADGRIVTLERGAIVALGRGDFALLPAPVWLVLGLYAGTALLLRRTRAGLWLECSGENPRAARICGLPVAAAELAAYAACGLCAALAGLVATGDLQAADADQLGLYVELDAILAVVLGGTALTGGRMRPFGTLLGVLIVQTLATALLMLDVSKEAGLVLKGCLVLALCGGRR